MNGYCFVDDNGRLWARGTVIKFPSLFDHEAIIDYAWNGDQVLLEKSKQHRKPMVASPAQYIGIRYVVSRVPSSADHSRRIVEHSYAEIQAGAPWTPFDNSQDFVSRAYGARGGSETRNFLFGVLAVFGLVGFAVASSR
jgi:hypothetical protein